LLVKDRIKGHAVVASLENSAVAQAHVKDERITRIERNVGDAPAHDRWSDGTRLEILKQNIGQGR
jgi:hypothetical protein